MTDRALKFQIGAATAEFDAAIRGVIADFRALTAQARQSMGEASTSAAPLIEAINRVGVNAQAAGRQVAGGLNVSAQMDALRASVDGAYATVSKFAQAQAVAQGAVLAGSMSSEEAARVLEALAAKWGVAAAAAEHFATQQETMAAAVRNGSMSQEEADTALSGLAQKLGLTEGATERLAAEARGAATAMQELVNTTTGVTGPMSSAAASAEAFAMALDLQERINALRASVDQGFAATQRFEAAQATAAEAVRLGAVSQEEADRTLGLLAQKLGLAEAASVRFSQAQAAAAMSSRANAAASQNVAFQFNDIAMMIAAGQNPLMLAMQQGSQLAQIMGQMGGEAGGAAAKINALKAGFMAFLSPTTLVTIGLVAGGAALAQWAMSAIGAGEETKSLGDRIKDLKTAQDEYAAAAKAASQPIGDLQARYGALADEVRQAMLVLAEAKRQLAETKLRDVVGEIGLDLPGTGLGDIERQLAAAQRSVDVQRTYGALSGAPTDDTMQRFAEAQAAVASLQVQMQAYRATIGDIAVQYGITDAQAERLVRSYEALETAGSDAGAAAEAAAALQGEMIRAFGSEAAAVAAMPKLMEQLSETIQAAAGIAATTDGIEPSLAAAAATADRLGEAMKRVRDLSQSTDDLLMSRLQLQYKGDAIGMAAARAGAEFDQARKGTAGADPTVIAWLEKERQAYIARAVEIEKNRQAVEALNAAEKAGLDASASLADLQREADLRAVILRFGEDSLEVELARVAQARALFAEQLDGWTKTGAITQAYADELMRAWDAARGIASTDMAGQIAAAIGPASQLAETLRRAASWWGPVQALAQRAAEGGWWGGIAARLGLGATSEAPMTSPPPKKRKDDTGVDMDGNGVPDWAETGTRAGGGGASGGAGGSAGASLADVQREAQQVLAALDGTIATIREKLRAGLLSEAEAVQEITRAKEGAAEKLAEIVPRLEAFGAAGKAAAETWRVSLKELVSDLGTAGSEIGKLGEESFKSVFGALIRGAGDAQDAVDRMADRILDRLAEMATDQVWASLIQPLVGKVFAGFGGGAAAAGGVKMFADGGVPDDADLSAWSNRIVDGPTAFPMRGGMGVMGEAGREAILPLVGADMVRAMGPDGVAAMARLIRAPGGALAVALPPAPRAPVPPALAALQRLSRPALRGASVSAPEAPVPPLVAALTAGAARAAAQARAPSEGPRPVWRPPVFREIGALAASAARGPFGEGAGAAPPPGPDAAAERFGGAVRQVVNIQQPAGMQAQTVERTEDGPQGVSQIMDVIFEAVDARMGQNLRAGRGVSAAALAETFGLQRKPR